MLNKNAESISPHPAVTVAISALSMLWTVMTVALMLGSALAYSPTAHAANGQCKWEGGAGADGGSLYCATEDCIGDGGNALCTAGAGAASNDSSLGPDKWLYGACEEVAGSTPRDAMWCAAAGGTWAGPTVGCQNLPGGFVGPSGYSANSEGPLTSTAYAYANRGSCQGGVSSDTGWNATFTSLWCSGGAPTYKLGTLITDHRRQTFSCGTTITYLRTRDAKCPPSYKFRTGVRGDECYMPQACCTTGNPVSPATGAKLEQEVDYRGPATGGLELRRYYNSAGYFRPRILNTAQDSTEAQLPGDFWRHSFSRRFYPVSGSSQVSAMIQFPNGSVISFDSTGKERGNLSGGGAQLQFTAGVGWDLTLASRDVEHYNLAGQLTSITTRAGMVTTITYSGLQMTVSDPFGHSLVLTQNSDGQLVTATLPDTGIINYAYDDYKRLTTVTYPDTTTRVYSYGDVRNWWLLTSIQDESGQVYGSYSYDALGRATSSVHAGGADSHTFTYNSNGTTSVTDPTGASTVWSFSASGGGVKRAGLSLPCVDCGTVASSVFDTSGNLSSQTDFNGVQTLFLYDSARNLETWRNEAAGTPQSRVIETQWHATFRLPTQIERAGQRENLTYDTNGNLLTRVVTDTVTSDTRTWTYTYNAYGQLLTEDGPRTDVSDVTTYTYNSCTSGFGCGQLASVTDAAGNVTTFLTYDANGRPLTMSDPNSVVTTLTYDERQRLTSRTIGTETTSYAYWPTGLLKKTTLPDGSFLLSTYDAAHRLVSTEDGEGNKISFTLDAAGNRTKAEVFDPSHALSRSRQWAFDNLGRLYQEIGAASQTTTFAYDDIGNLLAVTDPRNRPTQYEYDPLGRRSTVTDAIGGVTQYAYDARDNLLSVTDPRGLPTSYTYNAFGDVKALNSPDTGVTEYERDRAGNVALSTDARNKDADYSYDALGRVTQIEYSDQTIAFTYDTGANGKGRLNGFSDGSGSTQYAYDTHGRVTGKTQTSGSVVRTVGYGYNASGQLETLTTPSGQVIHYTYANDRVSSITVNSTPLLSNVLYTPFGPTRGWQWGNGSFTVREYDTDGRVTQVDSAGLSTYSYFPDGTIQSISNDDPSPGNIATDSVALNVAATSNRIASTVAAPSSATRTYVYDDAGNTTSDGLHTFTYNDAGRLSASILSGNPTVYAYNAQGQRVKKSGAAGTFYFVYDEAGRYLGQYDATGALVEEIVWLGDVPVATLRTNTGGGIGLFYIHTDHLNTPVRLTRVEDNTIMWRWDRDPYGDGAPDEDADGNGAFVFFNMRFPGQFADVESGLNYNYRRDGYDPSTGRYTQSDPIGLRGGTNTYAYVRGNPISNVDPRGLLALSMSFTWRDVSATALRAMGVQGPGFTDPHLPPPKCRCEGCGRSWKLIQCSATIDVDVLIEAGMPPGIDRRTREAEQQHVTDLENGVLELADAAVLAEQDMRNRKEPFTSQEQCENDSAEAVWKALDRALRRITTMSRRIWDESGRHKIWRPGSTYN